MDFDMLDADTAKNGQESQSTNINLINLFNFFMQTPIASFEYQSIRQLVETKHGYDLFLGIINFFKREKQIVILCLIFFLFLFF